MSGDLLAVDRVTKSYAFGGLFGRGAFNAVDDVSFTLEAARPEIFTIVGELGSRQDDARTHDPQPDRADVRRHPL